MRSAKQFGLSVGTLAVASVFVLCSQANAGWGSSGGWGSSSSGGGWGSSSSSSGGYRTGWGSSSSGGRHHHGGWGSSSSSGGWHARHQARKAARRAYRHSSSSGSSSSGSWGRSGWGSSSSGGYSYGGSSSSGGYSNGGSSSSGGSHYESYDDGGWVPADEAAPTDETPDPPAGTEDTPVPPPTASINSVNTSVSFTVNVSEDVKIFVNDNATSSTGTERTYVSRGLQAGKSYTFNVRAEALRNGESVTEVKQIRLVAGQHTSLAFEFAPNANEQLAEKAVETKLTLNVPAEAKVFLSGNATSSTGPVREFATTKLIPGKSWADYVVVVTYEKDGQLLTQEKNVTIAAGDAREVTFDFNTDTVASLQR